MTKRSNYGETCWRDRTSLELALIGILLAAILLSVAFAILITVHNKLPQRACNSSECINQAASVLERIDLNVDPCQDFYKFSCGNFLKNSHGDKKLGPFLFVQDNVDRQLLELYTSPVQQNEPRIVKMAKTLFSTCMNVSAIEHDDLNSILKLLKEVGGWPVLDALNWNATKFNWIQTTFKLRELGLPFAIFFNLSLTNDPVEPDSYILELSIPTETNFFNAKDHKRKKYMVDIAVALGADKNLANKDMERLLELSHRLQQRNYSSTHTTKQSRRLKISDFNKEHKHYLNVLAFINALVGPAVRLTNDDFVIFPQPDILNNWLYLIFKTSKRDIANYMIWKVIEDIIPYSVQKLQNNNGLINGENRSKFCLRNTQKRFSPSPMNILYAQKYLSMSIRSELESMVNNLKETFVDVVKGMKWIEEKHKQNLLKKISDMKVILGAPDDYQNEKNFKDLEIDIMSTKDRSFLTLLRQANRNLQSGIYKKINERRSNIESQRWYEGIAADYVLYDKENNIIRIPITLLQDVFFNNNRPLYMNYGGIGSGIAHEMVNLLTEENNQSKLECFENHVTDLNFDYDKLLVMAAFRETVALKIAYAGYKKWANEKGQEPELIGIEYSPKQLFWISVAFTTCQPISLEENLFGSNQEMNYYQFLVNEPMRNNFDFSLDFKCTKGSPMNPKNKCTFF